MSVTTPPMKRRVNIVGGDQIQEGAITFDKVEPDLLSRIESITLKAKINYSTFTTPDNGEIYLHGQINGVDADVDGYIYHGGIRYDIPRGIVRTQLNQEGYLIYSKAEDFATRGMNVLGQDVVAAFVSDGIWWYDDNDGTPEPYTPNPDTDIVIGYFRTGGADLIEDAYIFKDPVTVNEIVITSRRILANSILAEHITAGEIVTAHMQANSIEGDRIKANTLDAEKIRTSTLHADLTLSGSIKTGETGARVEMDALGIRAYNNLEEETLNVDSEDGSVVIVGGLQAGGEVQGATITGGIIRTNLAPTTDGIVIDDTNGLRAFEAGVLNTQINRLGVANFRKVTIAGLPADVTFSVGSGNSIFRVDNNGMYLGSSTFGTAPFRVNYDGSAILTAATLTGIDLPVDGKIIQTTNFSVDAEGDVEANSIKVTDGEISGGTIDIGGDDATSFHVDESGQMWLGSILYDNAPFRVSNTGALDIGGVDGSSFHIDNAGNMWSGAGLPNEAPFRVTNTGALIASNVTITDDNATGNIINTANFTVSSTGTVSATSGVFNSGEINGNFSVTGNLNVNGGSINLASGDLNVDGTGNINVSNGEVIVSADGAMRSANYDAGAETGWYLGPTGLDLNGLSIDAGSLQIGISGTNLFSNSSFENGVTGATNWVPFTTGGANATFSVTNLDFLFQSKSQRVNITGAGQFAGVYQDVAFPNVIQPGESITVSYWVKQSAGAFRTGRIWFHAYGSSTTILRNSHTQTLSGNWTRVVDTFIPTQPIATGLRIYLIVGDNLAGGDNFYFDGAQIQRSDFVTDYQPAPLDIPDNYIQSSHIAELSADRLTSGIMSAQTITVGAAGHIQSFDWDSGSGYRLNSDGAIFQEGGITIIGAAGGAVLIDPNEFRVSYGSQNHLVANSGGLTLAGTIKVTNTSIETTNFSDTAGWKIGADGKAYFGEVRIRSALFLGPNQVGATGSPTSNNDFLSSSNYQPGVEGWAIRGNGDVEFRNGTFRGQVIATSGTFSGSLQAASGTFTGDLSAAGGTFTGDLSAAGGTFTGTLSGVDGTFEGSVAAANFTGATIVGANIRTSADSTRVELNTAGLGFYMAGAGYLGTIMSYNSPIFGGVIGIQSTAIVTGGFGAMSTGYFGSTVTVDNGGMNITGPVDVNGRVKVVDGSAANPGLQFRSDTSTGISRTVGSLRFHYQGSTPLQISNTNVSVTSGTSFTANDQAYFPSINNAASANVVTYFGGGGGGALGWYNLSQLIGASSIRYKENVKPVEDFEGDTLSAVEKRVLGLSPVTFNYKRDTEDDVQLGLIAEAVAEQLEEHDYFFVGKDEEGRPDTVRYDRISLALIPIIKKIAQRLDMIE